MYTAQRPGEEGPLRRRGPPQQQEEEDKPTTASTPPPEATPVDAVKATLNYVSFLLRTLWDWARFLVAYFRFDVALLSVLSIVLLPWLARRVLDSVVGRIFLPSVLGKGFEETKNAYQHWISAAIDRLIPPPGVDEEKAGEGIINTLNAVTGGGGSNKGRWWKPHVGSWVIRGLRWAVKHALGVQ